MAGEGTWKNFEESIGSGERGSGFSIWVIGEEKVGSDLQKQGIMKSVSSF